MGNEGEDADGEELDSIEDIFSGYEKCLTEQ